jgi:hypothetical protein
MKNLFFAAIAVLSLSFAVAPAYASWRTADTATQRVHQN